MSGKTSSTFWNSCKNGLRVQFYVQPGAKMTELVELYDSDRIKVRLQAPPVEGKANKELTKWVAKECGLPKSSVQIVKGETSREKTILLEGVTELPALFSSFCTTEKKGSKK
eukprot:m.8399 g.8399  ORF g.8399 m.8399 type:complete len:112 (-) comp3109_c0_seq1:94-429(-)